MTSLKSLVWILAVLTIMTESAFIKRPLFANENSVRPRIAVTPNLLEDYLPSFSRWMRSFEMVDEDLKTKLEITLPHEDQVSPLLRLNRLI